MPKLNAMVFAPTWLRCLGCVMAMLPFVFLVVVIGCGWATNVPIVTVVACALVFRAGFTTLVSGSAPNSGMTIVSTMCDEILRVRRRGLS